MEQQVQLGQAWQDKEGIRRLVVCRIDGDPNDGNPYVVLYLQANSRVTTRIRLAQLLKRFRLVT